MPSKKSNSRRKSNSPGSRGVLVLMLIAAVGVAGFAAYVKFTPGASRVADEVRRDRDAVTRPAPSVDVETKPTTDPEQGQRMRLMVPALAGQDVKLSKPAGTMPSGVDPQVFVLTETFKSMGVPEGRALKIDLKGGTAEVEVNQAFVEHGYGSAEEGNLIKAIQLALGQFQDVDRFTLTEGGNPVELGHLDLSEPIEVIRPDQTSDTPAN